MNVRLFLAQRVSAAILAPLIVCHLVVIVYATQKGLSATDILGRTRGSIAWALFYSLFVVAAAVHGAIGLRTVLHEWGPPVAARSPRALDALMWGVGLLLAGFGLRAVYAVVA
jgi:fumarate reductase subunit C